MTNSKKHVGILTLTLALAGCGGGESTSASNSETKPLAGKTASPSSVPASLVGIYDVDFGGFLGIYTLLDDGRFSGIHYVNSFGIVGSPHTLLAPGAPTQTVRPITWSNFAAGGGLGVFERGARFNRALMGTALTFELSSEDIGLFSSTTRVQRSHGLGSNKTLYFDPIPLANLGGNYTGEGRTVGFQTPSQEISNFTLDTAGNFALTTANCNFKGSLIQHGNTGVFNLQATTSGASCRYLGVLSGIVTPISVIDNKPRLGLQLSTDSYSHSAVFVVQRK